MSAGPAGRPPLVRRFLRYQAERFPLVSFVPLISLFAFSSAAYSRLGRGAGGFLPLSRLAVGAFTSLCFFFMLRVLDEHKDAEVDRRYRPELPVPRGLVSLRELRGIATGALATAFLLNLAVAPVLLLPWIVIALWVTLMTVEFFVRDWLRAHAAAYLLTHMAVMPWVDLYTTGLDWLPAGAHPPHGLFWFLLVTFCNGVLIEIGRKIRAPGDEREGVDTYTRAWGQGPAVAAWLAALAGALASAWLAARATGGGALTHALLVAAALACAVPAARFARSATTARARAIDRASGMWPFVTYLLLGSLPYVARLLAHGGGR